MAEGRLDMQGVHRVHVLFSGSSLVTVSADRDGLASPRWVVPLVVCNEFKRAVRDAVGVDSVPRPPDCGAVAFVLRTGFGYAINMLITFDGNLLLGFHLFY